MKKLYAYLIQYNSKSDNPSYDVRYYEKELIIDNRSGFKTYRNSALDVYIEEDKCEHCGQRK